MPRGVTRLEGFNERVIALYARGTTVRDIRAFLLEMYGVEVSADLSADLISTITDAVVDELAEWQNRPLERVHPILYLDAIVCTVRHEGSVRNKPPIWPSASTAMATSTCWASGSRRPRGPSSG